MTVYGVAGNIVPAAWHTDSHRENSRRFPDIKDGFFRWVRKQMPSPGASAYALESLGLVEFAPFNTGILPHFRFKILQGQVLRQDAPAVLTVGLGGLVNGQYKLTPLYDPTNNTFGGQPVPSGSALTQEFPSNTGMG